MCAAVDEIAERAEDYALTQGWFPLQLVRRARCRRAGRSIFHSRSVDQPDVCFQPREYPGKARGCLRAGQAPLRKR